MAWMLWRAESSLALFLTLLLPCCKSQPCTDYDLRLVGGLVPNVGGVEVCVSSEWGKVCDSWDNSVAKVVCRQLGYVAEDAIFYPGYFFGIGNGVFLLNDIQCNGSETRLIDCSYDNMTSDCSNYYSETGVRCNPLLQAPQEISVFKVDDKSIFVSWSSPAAQTHVTSIQNYSVTCSNIGQLEVVYSNFSNYSRWGQVNGLQPCSNYNCCVSAFSVAGEGHQMCDTGRTLDNAPDAPQNIQGYPRSSTSLFLSWDHSQNDLYYLNGCIKQYHIYCSERESSTELDTYTVSVERYISLHLLHPYYTYNCRVAAIATGEGSASSPIIIQTFSALPSSAPQNIDTSAISSSAVLIRWSKLPQQDQNGIISKYVITVTNTRTLTVFLISTEMNQNLYEVKSLRPYTYYTFAVAAENMNGTGPFSEDETVQTYEDVPSAPPKNLNVTAVATTSVHLVWNPPPLENHNGIIIGYVIMINGTNFQEFRNTSSNTTEHTVDSLSPKIVYCFSIAAETSVGTGPFSDTIMQETDFEPIPAVSGAVIAAAVSVSSITICIAAAVTFFVGYKKFKHSRTNTESKDDSLETLTMKPVPFHLDQHVELQEKQSNNLYENFPLSLKASENKEDPTPALQDSDSFTKHEQPPQVPKHGVTSQQSSTILTSSASLDRRIHKTLHVQQMTLRPEETEQSLTKDQPPPVPKHGVKNQQTLLNPTPIMRYHTASLDRHTHMKLQQMAVPPEETKQSLTKRKQPLPVPKHGRRQFRSNLASTSGSLATSLDGHSDKTLKQTVISPEETEQNCPKNEQPPLVPKHGIKDQQQRPNPTQTMGNLTASLDRHSHKSLPQMAVFPKKKKHSFIKDKQSPPVPKSEAFLNHGLTDEQPTPDSTHTPGNLTFSLDHRVHETLEQMTVTQESDHSCMKDEPASPDQPTTLTGFTLSINPHLHKVLERMTVPQETEDRFTRELPPPVPERTQNYNKTVNNSMKQRLLRSFRRDRYHRKKPKKEDPTAAPQTVTFAVDQHIHSALQQIAAIQNHTDKEGTDTVVHGKEPPPSAQKKVRRPRCHAYCSPGWQLKQADE